MFNSGYLLTLKYLRSLMIPIAFIIPIEYSDAIWGMDYSLEAVLYLFEKPYSADILLKSKD